MPDTSPPPRDASARAAAIVAELRAIVGDRGMLTEPSDTAPYAEDWRRLYQGRTPAVVRPATTDEVAAVMRLCAARGVAVVAQGGNTSMVGGAVPADDGGEIVLSLARMARIRAVDAVDLTLTLEAGVTLRAAQLAAAEAGCLLPLSIASEGTAQIGGVLATNAGGNNTVRYGNARDLVLGLEVVLPDGQTWHGLRRLRKDNTGYCLRQLFVGSEGTLGIITAAVLKLAPRPVEIEVAFCAVPSPEAALDLFSRFQRHDPAAVQAFEYMSAEGLGLVLKHIAGTTLPVAAGAPHYCLVELATPRAGARLREALEDVLAGAMEAGVLLDAVIAESEAQRGAIWKLREEHSEAQKREGASVKNDVSVPVSAVPALIRRATEACAALMPGIRVVAFGHMGDGNIHFNLEQPVGMDPAAFLARDHAIMDAVGGVVRALDGSFSAEHGVGRLKAYMMDDWRGGAELDAMRRIKQALDPAGIMNPGKLLPLAHDLPDTSPVPAPMVASDIPEPHRTEFRMATHRLDATPQTIRWGVFDAAIPPVLTVASGDTVEIECVSGSPEVMPPDGSGFHIPPALAAIHASDMPRAPGHLITGPVAVAGAMPGDMLEVRVDHIALGADWGFCGFRPLAGTLPEDFTERFLTHIPIDRQAGTCRMPYGVELKLAPFFGVMGVAPPPNYGTISTVQPREHGGNLDNKEVGAGSTLFLPVWAEGGLFSCGDGHGVQGDGEVCINALETCLTGTFTFTLHKKVGAAPMLSYPRAETATHFISMGMDSDLDVAMKKALREMIAFIAARSNLSREQAYQFCSLAVDFHVTQTVNGEKGVHGLLRKGLLF